LILVGPNSGTARGGIDTVGLRTGLGQELGRSFGPAVVMPRGPTCDTIRNLLTVVKTLQHQCQTVRTYRH